ncbi:nitroreductase [Neobacillus sp. OS1-32]|uniref:nitroreductase family protein n=1 Tax=Neobacillus sp. OS1-32 TaxID=3070682 RepID=UPI0027E142E0|nr:nitroreductase [Neobacillus sp. OS1-32]WML31268.1 nitroreductase [Neobacillus sp. OS1-32]
MNILDLIKSRRNIKKFKVDAVDSNLIQQWLEAAAMAPNHRLTEPWEICVIGPETRKKLNHKTNFGNAPFVMAVLSRHGATKVETEENAAATACFIQNFNLAAWSEGVGTFWSSIAIKGSNRQLLEIPENYDVLGVLAVGYPEEIPEPKPRTSIKEKIKYLP